MQLLVITKNFPPTRGGIEKLCFEYVQGYQKYGAVHVIGPSGGESLVGKHVIYHACPLKPLPLFFFTALIQILKLNKESISRVLGGSGLVAPLVIIASRLYRAKAALLLHGLDLVYANWPYQKLFAPFIRKVDLLVSNSSATFTCALEFLSGASYPKIETVLPGVSVISKCRVSEQQDEVEVATLARQNRPTLLFVGRLIPRKGVAEFISYSLPLIVEAIPDVEFIVIGNEPGLHLSDNSSYSAKIRNSIVQSNLQENVRLLGDVSDATLVSAFIHADLFVFPIIRRSGDMEGFGIVNVEAAAYGLPSIAFSEGGVIDAVKDNETGYLIESGNYPGFAKSCIEGLHFNLKDKMRDRCLQWANERSWSRYTDELTRVIEEIK